MIFRTRIEYFFLIKMESAFSHLNNIGSSVELQ